MKTKEQLLQDYKKSNKYRRQRILKLKGYATEAEYFNFLLNKKSTIKKSVSGLSKSIDDKTFTKKDTKQLVDYVAAFDTTGSMNSYINSVKAHVAKVIPEMFANNEDLKMKIVAFGDYCDMPSAKNFGNAYQESEFVDSKQQQHLIDFVKNAKSTGGGDSDEFYELVIKKIIEETPWRKGSKKVVLLIADDNPHSVGYSYHGIVSNAQIDWKQEAQKAKKLGITFDTLSIHAYNKWYAQLSEITGGIHMPFKSSNKMQEVFTASTYARGGSAAKAKFRSAYATATASGDEELIGTYKSLSSLL